MTTEARHELSGCLSMLLCLLVLAVCGVWMVFSNYWPQALIGGLLALAVLLKD